MDVTERLGGRYDLLEEIGRGGMGIVFRAHDRLTGQQIALKRVQVRPGGLVFGSMGGSDLDTALAQEFSMLAGLRHPRVISVLDYGFDPYGLPYYTMPLLKNPRNLARAAAGQSVKVRLSLLAHTLEALVYLHRRGILHRDLKPANVLVTPENGVQVVDFGLALHINETRDIRNAGTLGYIAPELYMGGRPTPSTDLWAFGVMFFELLVGVHPFSGHGDDDAQVMTNVLYGQPELSALLATLDRVNETEGLSSQRLTDLAGWLLHPDPAQRCDSAAAALAVLSDQLDLPLGESLAAREGFLQAAMFVGREQPYQALLTAYQEALAGKAAVWLVGGESGVGKSRLVDEVCITARVRGALVLRGQAAANGGIVLQAWRDVMPMLALHAGLNDIEAAALRPFSPDLSPVLGREVGTPPALDADAALERASDVLVDALLRLDRPTLLVLEDLQWASHSLVPLRRLMRRMDGAKLLVIGTFRNDERPDLPSELSGARVLVLDRFDDDTTAALTSSMLGPDVARRADVIALLRRETEGNAFFLVETVRALAEEAGALMRVGLEDLPARVLAGGVRQVVMRRLGRVPQAARWMLNAAALMGRQLELDVLEALRGYAPSDAAPALELWLTQCADASVLELRDQRWRFSHDKLREALLDDLSASAAKPLHHAIARARERVSPAHRLQWELAPVMAAHWAAAEQPERERPYREWAGEYCSHLGDFKASLVHYQRAVALYAADDFSAKALITRILLASTLTELSRYDEAYSILLPMLEDARIPNDVVWQVHHYLSKLYLLHGRMSEASHHAEVSLELAANYATPESYLQVRHMAGNIAVRRGEFDQAEAHYKDVLAQADTELLRANAAYGLAQINIERHDLENARRYAHQAIEMYERIGHLAGETDAANLLGIIHGRLEVRSAIVYFRRALEHAERAGMLVLTARLLSNIAIETRKAGDSDGAIRLLYQALGMFEQMGDSYGMSGALLNLSKTLELVGGRDDEAERVVRRALAAALSVDGGLMYPHGLIGLARIALRRGDVVTAARCAAVVEHHSADNRLRTEASALLDGLSEPLRDRSRAEATHLTPADLVRSVVDAGEVS